MNKLKLEVLTFKYLLKNIVYAIHDLNMKVDLLLDEHGIGYNRKQLHVLPMSDKGNDIYFDMFSLTKIQYSNLIDEYGLDLTTQCCVALDDFIRDKGYIPYGKPLKAIKKVLSVNLSKEKKEKVYEDIPIYESIKYEDISNVDEAKKYIMSIPKHKRNITKEVIELIDRFNIKTLSLKDTNEQDNNNG